MSSLGPADLVLALVIALIVFGPERLPEAGRSLNRRMRAFKQG